MPTIETVAALLAKAERTDNADEAEAYLAKAQRLATVHAIDLAALSARATASGRSTVVPVQRTIRIGEPRKHANPHLVSLFSAIARPNDVLIDVAHNSTYVIAYGLPDDVDTCESIWLACAPRMVATAQHWLRSKRWSGDTRPEWTPRGWTHVPVTARTAKATFMVAFVERIGTRLTEARARAIRDVDAHGHDHPTNGVAGGAELVLVAKADQVQSFYRQASRARGSWRGYSGSLGGRNSASARAGDAAAATTALGTEPALGAARELDAG